MAEEKPFFVGYLPVPWPLRLFLWAVTAALLIGAGVLSYWIGTTQNDPGTAGIRGDFGRQTLTGVIEMTPTPILHVTEGTDRIPVGRTIMMSGGGKSGAEGRAGVAQGALVRASGAILQRGDLEMLQLRGGMRGMQPAMGDAPEVPAPEDLGRWRLAGEICDGKCLAGAMRPGRGLAHKACANLCVSSGVPPVFVTTQPVEGAEFMLISGPDGAEIPQAVYDRMAQYISVEGQIRRHGDLLVFNMDPDSIEVLP